MAKRARSEGSEEDEAPKPRPAGGQPSYQSAMERRETMLEGRAQAAVMRPSEQVSGPCERAWLGVGKLWQGKAALGAVPTGLGLSRVCCTWALLLDLLPLSRQMVHRCTYMLQPWC